MQPTKPTPPSSQPRVAALRRPRPTPKSAPASRPASPPAPIEAASEGGVEPKIEDSAPRALVPVSSKPQAEYARTELYAVAEIGYHYLRCGGYQLAEALFEGLVEIAPNDAYLALALGTAKKTMGDNISAARWFERARELDPSDGYADVNLAEVLLASGDLRRATPLIESGARKAAKKKNAALTQKAESMLQLIRAKPGTGR